MTSRIPEPPSPFEAEGVPDPGDSSEAQLATGEAGQGYGEEPPHDHALAADDFGTTAEEEHDGEPLDARLSREEPDVLATVAEAPDESVGSDTPFDERAGQGVGRLVEPDEGGRGDAEADLVASDAGTDLGGYTAEETAMHVEPEA